MATEKPTFVEVVPTDQSHQVLGAAKRTGAMVREVVPSGHPFRATPDAAPQTLPQDQVGIRLSGDPKAFHGELSHIRELTPGSLWSRVRAWVNSGAISTSTVTGNVEVVQYRRAIGGRSGDVVVPETGQTASVRSARDIFAVYVHDPLNNTTTLVSRTRAKKMPTRTAVDLVRGTKKG
jgi:hypothetical protein